MSNFLNKFLAIVALLAGVVHADQIATSSFKYLNSNESPAIIDPAEAQDLLNVDITPGGKSVKKRQGYALYKQVFATSSGVHGGYHAFDSSGNDVQIWESSASVKTVVADGAPNTIISSATTNATLDCVDTQGSIYCVNSARDFYIRTNGTTLTNWYTSPLGTMIEATPDRIVVAGVSASPNTLFVSQSNTFTNFTVGVNTTDAFTEVIAAPGSHLTHIRWGCQRLLWWKDQSFGYFDFDDQYSADIRIVADNIGTFDNTSAIDPGGNVWFRGQDGHTYKYDCSSLERMTVDITPQVQSSGRRTTNLWTQTTQADWQSGASVPTGRVSTTLSVGDVVVSTFGVTENTSTSQWASGTKINFAVGTSSLSLLVNNSGDINDAGFEGTLSTNWTASSFAASASQAASGCTISPDAGSQYAQAGGSTSKPAGPTMHVIIADASLATLVDDSFSCTASCAGWASHTTTLASATGKRVFFKFTAAYVSPGTATLITKASYIFGGSITTRYRCDDFSGICSGGGSCGYASFDHIQNGSSTVSSGSFTSQTFDTTFTSNTVLAQANWTVNGSTPAFSVITASNSTTGPWTQVLSSTGSNASAFRFLRYVSTITANPPDDALTSITQATLQVGTTGSIYSAWKAAPNFTAWGTFNPTSVDNGGSHSFFVRASTSPQSVTNSTVTWIAQTPNAQVATSTAGIFFQIRDDFSITAATSTPTLNDFTVNWFEGSAGDQAYMLYFDNAIWESVAYGVGISSNNYIFRQDLINQGWGLYYFGAGGMLVQNNHLFFGSVGDGNVYQYGSGTSDAGVAMTSYWKSREFGGEDPFLQNQLTNIDTFATKNTGQSISATYTTDTATSTSYTISLSSTTQTIIQNRKLLPSGKLGYTFNFKVGDATTTSAWEVLGFRIGYTQLPYRPSQ